MTKEQAPSILEVFARRDEASALYDQLTTRGMLARARVLEYRCTDRGCVVLDLVRRADTGELIAGIPAYKTSPAHTATNSSVDGRTKNTRDGERHWRRHADYFDATQEWPTSGDRFMFSLQCDHLRAVTLEYADVAADLASGVSLVRVSRNGHRYAV